MSLSAHAPPPLSQQVETADLQIMNSCQRAEAAETQGLFNV